MDESLLLMLRTMQCVLSDAVFMIEELAPGSEAPLTTKEEVMEAYQQRMHLQACLTVGHDGQLDGGHHEVVVERLLPASGGEGHA